MFKRKENIDIDNSRIQLDIDEYNFIVSENEKRGFIINREPFVCYASILPRIDSGTWAIKKALAGRDMEIVKMEIEDNFLKEHNVKGCLCWKITGLKI